MAFQQIVAFLSSGTYYYAEYSAGIFFHPVHFNPTHYNFVSKPPRNDWIEYIQNIQFEIYDGVEWVSIHIESVFETLETKQGHVIPVFRVKPGAVPALYQSIPRMHIMRRSTSELYFHELLHEKADVCSITIVGTD